MPEKVFDPRVVRGMVLSILKAYQSPEDPDCEKDIEQILPLLQYAEQPIRNQAAAVTRIWLGLKHRDPIRFRRLIFYRLRHLDNELSRLERMTRPEAKCSKSS